MPIWLDVDSRSGVPLYVQIVDGVKRALSVGSLRQGDRLPTVQKLSSELMIAPNTIVKAYGELQRLGLIESRAGAGTVVSASAAASINETQRLALDARIRVLIRDAQSLGLERQDLAARFAAALAEMDDASTVNLSTEQGDGQAAQEVTEE